MDRVLVVVPTAAAIPTDHEVEVQVYLDQHHQECVLVRDLVANIAYAEDAALDGPPSDVVVQDGMRDEARVAPRARRPVRTWRGHVVDSTVSNLRQGSGAWETRTTLTIERGRAPYR